MFAETTIPIELDGPRMMVFNANTMGAFEEKSGKFFMDFMGQVFDALHPKADPTSSEMPLKLASAWDIVRKIPVRDIHLLVWAAIHTYDEDDFPSWPLTPGRVGRLIQFQDIPDILTAIMRGHNKNSPTKAEMGESPARSVPAAPLSAGDAPSTEAGNGGERSIVLPADAFA